jgi:Ser-tRNA(Ala) deacylase AlaX
MQIIVCKKSYEYFPQVNKVLRWIHCPHLRMHHQNACATFHVRDLEAVKHNKYLLLEK